MSLTPEQTFFIVIFVVPILGQIIKLVSAKFGKDVTKAWTTVFILIISILISIWWISPVLPKDGDTLTNIEFMIGIAGSVFGFATIIYNLILSKIFNATNLTKENFLPSVTIDPEDITT